MEITGQFKWVFLTVSAITFFCLLCVLGLAFFGNNATNVGEIPVMQKNLYMMVSFGWQSGFGAILGLVGGKVTATDRG